MPGLNAIGRALDDAYESLRSWLGLGDDAPQSCSFSGDTAVETPDGTQPISALQEGDLVLAYDGSSGSTGYYPISAVLAHLDQIVELVTIAGERIQTTPEHPFYVVGKGWTPAGELRVGDRIRRADESFGVVEALRFERNPQAMYNLTVSHAHTFYVGKGEWLVHNTCAGSRLPPYRSGGPTSAIFLAGGEETPLTSGYDGPSAEMPADTPGMRTDLAARAHVEAHAAAMMRSKGIADADLWINKPGGPCSGIYGCDAMLSHMLPEGATLRVHYPQGDAWGTTTYVGVPDTQWVWPRN
jgi:hypothetical protein